MPVMYAYDDHDFAANNPDGTDPAKLNSLWAYKTFFPHYPLKNPDNGIWQIFIFGDVEFFVLDCRSQRNPNKNSLDANGNFLYRPTRNYCGLDSFNYQICDTNNLCAIASCIFEVICRDVTVFTGFSPNGDGINDNWVLPDIEGTINTVRIFDRWGRLVNSYTNYDNVSIVWDGTNSAGNQLISGTYFYAVEIENKPRRLGWIEITR
jgi:gliding motility-associated-like protein